jgi:hypothetical protein
MLGLSVRRASILLICLRYVAGVGSDFHPLDCDCPFTTAAAGSSLALHYHLRSFKLMGRTGNHLLIAAKSFALAAACRGVLHLNPEEELFGTTAMSHTFDFTGLLPRKTDLPETCATWSGSLTGTIWYINKILPVAISVAERNAMYGCMRRYFGMCHEDFCATADTDPDALTMHIRQEDIMGGMPLMGQPPLSMYLGAVLYRKWIHIRVLTLVGESPSPVYTFFEGLAGDSGSTNIIGIPVINNRSVHWTDDLRQLLCAHNIATSTSSLWNTLSWLGRARQFFVPRCTTVLLTPNQTHDNVSIVLFATDESYSPFKRWLGEPSQFQELSTGHSSGARLCGLSDRTPLDSFCCSPWKLMANHCPLVCPPLNVRPSGDNHQGNQRDDEVRQELPRHPKDGRGGNHAHDVR